MDTTISTHPPADRLAAFGLGLLDDTLSAEVESHLGGCDACRRKLELPPADDLIALVRATAPEAPSAALRNEGYEILEEVGRGGMAVVYRARQRGLGRIVALKRILAGAEASANDLARFRTEAAAVAHLTHPNIVQVFDVGEMDGRPYLALEFVAGGTLARRLAAGPLTARAAAEVVEPLARAADYAHCRGVVHRDLKPGNILIADCRFKIADLSDQSAILNLQSEIPKIADFGLAKRLDVSLAHTQTGALLGTPSYMAPEQAAGMSAEVGPLADIYALGAILYECLTGRPPFRAATVLETLEQVRLNDPVPPRHLQPGLPRDLETICLKCLEKEPRRRYATAADLADDLRRFLAGEPVRARPARAWERGAKWARRRPAWALVLLLTVLAFAGSGGGLIGHNARLRREVERAEKGETEARRQRRQVLDTFARSHDTLDEMLVNLNQTRNSFEDPLAHGLRQELAQIALRYYEDALRDADPDDPDVRLLRAKNLAYGGRLDHILERKDMAVRKHREAIALMEALTGEEPDNAEYQRELGFVLYRLGDLLTREKEYQEAETLLLRGREVFAAVPASDVDPHRTRWLLGCCSYQLTEVARATDRLPLAEKHGRQGVGVLQALVAAAPENARFRLTLARMLNRLSLVLLLQKKEAERRTFIAEWIAVLRPFHQARGVDYCAIHGRQLLARAYFASANQAARVDRDSDRALAEAASGIDVALALLSDDPTSRETRAGLYGLYRLRALMTPDAVERLADWDRALEFAYEDLKEGCRIERAAAYAAAGKHRDIADECRLLARNPRASAAHLYALAQCFGACMTPLDHPAHSGDAESVKAKDEYAAEALACLRRWQALGGFRDAKRREELATHPAFGPLRGRADFQGWQRQQGAP